MSRNLMFVAAISVATPTPSGPMMSLRDAVATALRANPAVSEQKERLEQYGTLETHAYSVLFPNISALAQANYRKDALNVGISRFGGTAYNQYSVDVRFTQPLLQPGILAGADLPRRDLELVRLDLDTTVRDLSAQVIRAYFNVLLGERRLTVLEATRKLDEDALSTAQRRFQTGRSPNLDVLQARTELALLESRLFEAKTNVRVAAAELANLLGDPDAGRLSVAGDLELPPFEEIRAPELQSSALPEYERVVVASKRLESERALVVGRNYPQLAAVGDIGRASFVRSELLKSSATAWTLGLQLTIPIFSGLSSVYERREFASRAAQLDFQRARVSNNLALAQVRSRESLALSQASIKSSALAFDLAGKAMAEARRDFRLSTIDFLKYLSVQTSYLNAQTALDQSRYNYLVSLVDYFTATGLPLQKLVDSLEGASP